MCNYNTTGKCSANARNLDAVEKPMQNRFSYQLFLFDFIICRPVDHKGKHCFSEWPIYFMPVHFLLSGLPCFCQIESHHCKSRGFFPLVSWKAPLDTMSKKTNSEGLLGFYLRQITSGSSNNKPKANIDACYKTGATVHKKGGQHSASVNVSPNIAF